MGQHAGICLDQKRGRLILFALLFTELLKFALRKSSQVKSAKSNITRTIIRKKALFPELKRKFQIFKRPSNLAQKVSVYLNLSWIGTILFKYEKQTKSTVNNHFESVRHNFLFKKGVIFFSKECFTCSSAK